MRRVKQLPEIEAQPISRRVGRQVASMMRQVFAASAPTGTVKEDPTRLSLEAWTKRYWSDGFSLPNSDMHRWTYDQLARADRERGVKINLIGPRSNAKSQLTTAYALRAAVEGREPYSWLVSDVDEQARGNLDSIREQLEDNPLIRAAYPEACQRGRRWAGGRLDLSNGCTIQAFGMMAKMRGRKKGSQRPSLIIGDDLQNDAIQTSGDQRTKQQRRFDDVILNAGTRRTNVIVVGTSLHRECISENLKRRPGWRSRTFSSIVRWPDAKELWAEWAKIYSDRETHGENSQDVAREFYLKHRAEMEAGAVVLWPEWESLYQLMEMREQNGYSSFEREKQGNPITPETCFFHEEWFTDRIYFDAWPTSPRCWAMSLDPSLGRTDHSDYSAYIWGCVSEDGLLYIDASIRRRTISDMVGDGVSLFRQLNPTAFFVETNQFQELLIGQFNQAAKEAGVLMAAHRVVNTENKEVRIRRLEPYLQSGRMRFKRNSPGVMLLLEQLRQFPNAMHDDGPDALEVWLRGLLSIQKRK